MVRFLRMEIFIQMMRHHPRNADFKCQLNRLNRLDSKFQDVNEKNKNKI